MRGKRTEIYYEWNQLNERQSKKKTKTDEQTSNSKEIKRTLRCIRENGESNFTTIKREQTLFIFWSSREIKKKKY